MSLRNKICSKCNLQKLLSEFRNKRNKCRQCERDYAASYALNNPNKIKENNKNYYCNNREVELDRVKNYQLSNKGKVKENNKNYYWNNREVELDRIKKYKLSNKSKINKTRNKYVKIRKKNDPIFKLRKLISDRIYQAIKNSKDNKSILEYLKYSIQELKDHLECQFESWMTWDNWGVYSSKTWDNNNQSTWTWQIDHIIPHSNFKYTNMNDEEFTECWALSNLRPYSAKQNLLDGARIKNVKTLRKSMGII